MAASKKRKVKQKEHPSARAIVQKQNPERYYTEKVSWNFHLCDTEMWRFTEETLKREFWSIVLPRLKSLELQTWNEILLDSKKQNHSTSTKNLNSIAQTRLAEKHIEGESIVSLRIDGTHRLYGFIVNGVYQILWYDNDHGDNNTCVYRSKKRHT